ncbi:hypothetical protein LAUMK191_04309 [Mycobacterium attenuatum]|nr:hypothetical protein LAUMK191_04309 [Mycobacterium attenuatum]VBA61052.1 hypothetical protein LAUMK41_04424 [Mycobacterium attenuatum]
MLVAVGNGVRAHRGRDRLGAERIGLGATAAIPKPGLRPHPGHYGPKGGTAVQAAPVSQASKR